jgi:hypothetical protein
MKPDRFLERELGWMSSHPMYQRRRRWLFQGLAFIPLGVVVLAGALLALNFEDWLRIIAQYHFWAVVTGAAISFALGVLISIAITARWGELQRRGKIKVQPAADPAFIERWVVGISIVLGIIGPVVALVLPEDLAAVRFAFHVFAVVPLLGLVIGMWVIASGPDSDEHKQRRPIWAILAVVLLALMVMTVIHDLAVAMGRRGFLSGFRPSWYKPFLGALVLAPLAYLFLTIWRLWPANRRVEKVSAREAAAAKKPGFFARLFTWIKNLFFPAAKRRIEESGNPWPDWLDELITQLPPGCRNTHPPEPLDRHDAAPLSTATELKYFFGSVVPTVDQEEMFQRFRDSYQEVVRDGWSWQSGTTVPPSADLLVQGDPGSGRTTALIACAVYAALGRGQRVLFLVANRQRQQIVKQRIKDLLTGLRIHQYVHCDNVTREPLEGWLSLDDDSHLDVLPHILIATLDDVEEHLYGAAHLDNVRLERLRRLVLLLEVVLVDDFMDFEDAQRSHLPFFLDKQRLLLEADYMPLQVVVTCPPLAKVARKTFGTRLFTETRLREQNVIMLRPRESGTAWHVDLEAENIAKIVDQMVVWCLKRGLDVVLYRRGIDEHELRRQESELRRHAGEAQGVSVIADLDQPLHVRPEEVDAVFYQVAAHEDVCLALRMHMGGDESVIFSVRPTGEIADRPVSGIVPVVADRSAMPLMVAHLRSAARFFRPGTPVSESTWSQFGLHYSQLDITRTDTAPEFRFRYDHWEEDERYRGQIFPYIALLHDSRVAARAVDTHSLPDETRIVYRLPHEPVFFIGQTSSDKERLQEDAPSHRRAVWYSSADQPLHRSTDLAHACEFRLVHGSEVYVPQPRIRHVEGHFRLKTLHWHGNGEDAYLPVFTIRWELNDVAADPLGGGPDYGIQWFSVETAKREPVTITATIEKLMTEYGIETPISSLKFSYPARLTSVFFRPTPMDPDSLKSTIGKLLSGHWGTAGLGRWSPVLTGSINYALQARLPGLSYFARSLAFWITDEDNKIASAVAWFVEPVTVGQTVMPILSRLLSNSEERKSFFGSVLWFLEQLQEVDSKPQFLRRFSRAGYYGDESMERLDDAYQLVRSIADRADTLTPRSKERQPV